MLLVITCTNSCCLCSPDGINHKGVLMSSVNGYFYCAKWWSQRVAMGTMVMKGSQASAGGLVATKALVKHIHMMSKVGGN